ncbi:hypothetical protein PFFVO_00473 [Plasmodium falciparum Vietnam Oak-Knoll (FVO)]|uniref:Uncharacterized protein n=1 Tax=Plasmodium falciparum Vietnam Oak-Knoll (FVO) TaxID=1036723 RepID=A0A024VD63_PLAFA|nr:hypothetical protein PFFVO_00473 [Plasmodium falciparum Vietnam Oak-Knoll (FVO)]
MDGDISRKSYVEILKYYSKDENKLGGHNFGKNKKKDLNKYDIYYKDYLYDYYKECNNNINNNSSSYYNKFNTEYTDCLKTDNSFFMTTLSNLKKDNDDNDVDCINKGGSYSNNNNNNNFCLNVEMLFSFLFCNIYIYIKFM